MSAERRTKADVGSGSLWSSLCAPRFALCARADTITVAVAVAIFSALSATLAFKSDAFLEGDACTHFMYARAAWTAPYYLVNVWGRPICTGLYAIPAHFGGRPAARLTSLAVAIAVALIARSIARRQGWRWPALAAVFTFAQPLVFLHSFSELTELPFALLMAVAFLAYQRRQWVWFALVVGLTPLSRPEGFGFVGLAAVALLLHGRARWWAVLAVPLVAWDVAGWRMYGKPGHWWMWLAANWPYAGDSLYNRGYLMKYVGMLPAITGPLVFPAALVGGWLCLRGSRDGVSGEPLPVGRVDRPSVPSRVLEYAGIEIRGRRLSWIAADHRRRCDVLIAAVPLLVLVGHSLLTWTGKMASNGEVRYMLIVAPFWALLSARGWAWVFGRLNWPAPRAWAGLAAALPLVVNRMYTVLPQRPMPDWVEAAHIADWYKAGPIHTYPHVALAHPGLLYALDLSPTGGRIVDWKRSSIDRVPPGTLLIWDRIDGLFNADATRSIPLDEIRRDGWVPVPTPFDGGAGEWHFFRSPDADHHAGAAARRRGGE